MICFKEKVIQEIKIKAPQYKAYWLCSFKKGKDGEVTPSLESVLNTLKLVHSDGLSSNITIPESFIEAMQKHGYEWHVWSVDDLKTSERAKALGAKSITTNMPKVIKGHLAGQAGGVRPATRSGSK